MRETPGADTLTPEAWEAEAEKCRRDGIPEPSRADWVRSCVEAGWTPSDPFHVELVEYEALRDHLGDAAIESESGPVLEWPDGWGAWSLARHRAEIVYHRREMERIREEESRHAGGR